jgi:site-specific recombinase XerD
MEYITVFTQYLANKPLAKTTRSQYLQDIQQFLAWFAQTYQQEFSAAEITSGQIARYTRQTNVSRSTRDRRCSSLRKFFTALQELGIIRNSPFCKQTPVRQEDRWDLTKYVASLRSSNLSELTRKHYLLDIKQFCWWVEQNGMSETTITTAVEAYLRVLLTYSGYAKATLQRKCVALRNYALWREETGTAMVQDKPTASFPLPAATSEPVPSPTGNP